MSPETHLPPPEPPIISLPEIAPETTAVQENADIAAPPKRQRRPSVRLGEIGDQHGNYRRHNRPPWSWRVSKESSRTSKPRAVSNLANGGDVDGDGDDFGNNPRNKPKRGSTKRLRSNHASKPIDENGSKRFKNFDHDHNPNSHTYSVDENDFMQMDRNNDNRVRVWENEGGVESESRERRKNEGVWSWLFDLGLSRYAPVFEMHEVDDDLLPLLTLEDLKDMGISAVGSRRKMYNAIEKLRKGF